MDGPGAHGTLEVWPLGLATALGSEKPPPSEKGPDQAASGPESRRDGVEAGAPHPAAQGPQRGADAVGKDPEARENQNPDPKMMNVWGSHLGMLRKICGRIVGD